MPSCQRELHESRPNIVYILADDMGTGDVRSYYPNSPVNTPNIDRIAGAGMRFDNAHTSSSVCSPTRYSLLTGRYAWRTRLTKEVVFPHEPALINPAQLTVAEMLKQVGYQTGAIGKWHLGMNWVTTDGLPARQDGTNVDYSQPFTGGPTDNGFDSYYGEDIIHWPPYAIMQDNHTIGIPAGPPVIPPGGNAPAGLVRPVTTHTRSFQ